jgi:hypothetical protein
VRFTCERHTLPGRAGRILRAMETLFPAAPGRYRYTDQPGHTEILDVVDDAGELCARFNDDGDVELVPVADMAGTWAPQP